MRSRAWLTSTILATSLLVACSKEATVSKDEHMARAKAFQEQKKLAEAIVELRGAIAADPKDGNARYQLANLYTATNDPGKAAGEFVRASDLSPDNLDAHLKAAQFLLLSGRFEDAKGRAERVLAKQPGDVNAHLMKGLALAGLKDYNAAVEQANDALAIDEKSVTSRVMLSRLQAQQGKLTEAEASLKKAIELAPDSSEGLLALANFYMATNRGAEAEAPLKRAVEVAPKNGAAHQALATYYLANKRPADAEASLKAVIGLAPNAPGPKLVLADFYMRNARVPEAVTLLTALASVEAAFAPANTQLAIVAFSEKRLPDAHKLVDAVLAKQPKFAPALIARARFLQAENKLPEAVTAAKAAVAADPRSGAAEETLGDLHVQRNELDEAVAAFGEAVRLAPGAFTPTLRLAQLHLQRGEVPQALQFAQEAARLSPEHPGARQILTRALAASGSVDRAEAGLAGLVKEFPQSAALQTDMGQILVRKKDFAGARRAFEKALQLDPDSVEALRGRVGMDLADKNAARATASVEERLKKSPTSAAVLLLAADTYRATGDAAKQESALRRAAEADPNNMTAFASLGRFFIEQRKLDQALREYQSLAAKMPKAPMPQLVVGMIQQAQNKPDEAVKTYQKLLSSAPRNAVAANNLAWLLAEKGENLDEALQVAQTAKEVLPDSGSISDTLGWVYLKKNLPELAIPAFKAAVDAEANNPEFHYHLGLAQAKSGDVGAAARSLDTALRLKPDYKAASEARKSLPARN